MPPVAPDDDAVLLKDLDRSSAQPQARPGTEMDLVAILSGVDETAYTWDMLTDRMDWESNAAAVLGLHSTKEVETGAKFQFLIAAEHVTRRQTAFDTSVVDDVDPAVPIDVRAGHAYRVQYRFLPQGRRSTTSLWIEDHGRWWTGADGQPVCARGVIRVINERYQEEQRLLYRSDHDELTGQLNRVRLTEALAAVIERSERTGQPSGFLVASIDNLARINETFGFDVGDAAIASVGRIIRDRLRGGDTIGRYSTNKFGIILNECGPGSIQIAAERFMRSVRETIVKTTACPISPTVSIGAVLLPEQAPSVTLAVGRALQALDKARQRRNGAFVAYEPSPAQESARLRNLKIADEVTSALEEHRMRLVLQPIVCSRTHRPAFYECLLRMVQPDGTTVGAGEFIELAEQLGMSRLIDRRTLELAVSLLKQFGDLTLSLNVSSNTCADPEWIVALHRLTGGQSALTKRLIVEITETSAIGDLDQTIAFVDTLREFGCRVAIDDFGAGYTSFRNLKQLNVDLVKLDGAFIKNLANDESDRVFVRMMAELSTAFGMETVAEWVTDAETAKIVADLGMTYMQGFHFSQPVEIGDLDRVRPDVALPR